MENKKFLAMVVSETEDQKYIRNISEKNTEDLPAGDVLIKVMFSSLNYKDALSSIGNKGVTRKYPHTPGIDAAGIVESSSSKDFKPGEEVIVTSYDLGMNTSGGFGQYIRVPEGWVIKKPQGLSLKESMIYGTAGLTAGLCVSGLLEHNIKPEAGEILVTGAAGGVGSIAVRLLSALGYDVVAVNGLNDETDYLKELGAKRIISIEDAVDRSGRPILKELWAGCIDTIGGEMLATAIKSTRAGGSVSCCGNVASGDLPLTVYPFILRGVTLIGIDSQNCPMPKRKKVWDKIANEWKLTDFEKMAEEISISDLDAKIDLMIAGKHRGRTIVNNWR
ncbi:YhdH/YhfP family quinone oxidoreductase [Desulforegula conservatrix]|uniref:YhdH/YhfP family quinone oxidoreductase n=1 Tax=Desulforegula conservatrix TaxID=153026 RepID=UPI00041B67A1|nr:YhdH/YhfP family quinone oxidoreductase [Desulforegula conservatrix]